ncbi:hypothetical protein NA78x_005417 [Anatilimnocola sp. NA78]|uniref:hypothetical protein n=1 Tax=Anatilimnocola sp. NA78 TaxID=3415683 RepID=UPI003CE4EBE7
MRYRWYFFVALLCLVAIGIGAVLRAYQPQQPAKHWLAEQALAAQLERPVHMEFGKPVLLATWMQEWSKQTGIAATIEADSLIDWSDERIALDLPSMPARDALQAFAACSRFEWDLQAGSIEFSATERPARVIALNYPLPATITAEEVDSLIEFTTTTLDPDGWSDVGGPGYIYANPGTLTIVQRRGAHERLQHYWKAFETLGHVGQLPQAASLASDPRLQAIPLCEDPESYLRLQQLLKQPASFDIDNQPLTVFAQAVSQALGIPVNVHPRLQTTSKFDMPLRVTCQMNDVSIRSALVATLSEKGLIYAPVASGRALLIEQEYLPRMFTTVLYPVNDLIIQPNGQANFDPLIELITSILEPDAWQDLGGPGSVNALDIGSVLEVHQSLEVHQNVQDLLDGLRTVLHSPLKGTVERSRPWSLARQMEKILEQPAELKYNQVPLREVISELQDRFSICIHLNDRSVDPEELVWCHLPKRRLAENLSEMLGALDLDFCLKSDYIEIDSDDYAQDLSSSYWEIYDLRSFAVRRFDIAHELEEFRALDGTNVSLGNLFVVRQTRDSSEELRELLKLIQRGAPSTSVSSEPLTWLTPADAKSQAELNGKLGALDSVNFRRTKLSDALQILAVRHELPLAQIAVPGGIPVDAVVNYQAENRPLREILSKLIGSNPANCRVTRTGFLRFTVPTELNPVVSVGALYDVSDLLVPRGKLQPGQLLRTLKGETKAKDEGLGVQSQAELFFDHLLSVGAPELIQQEYQQALKKLRDGSLQQLPVQPGDKTKRSRAPGLDRCSGFIPVVG